MNRLALLVFVVHCSCASTTIADDYLLRLDTIEHTDKPASGKDPKESVLRSIEVIAQPHSAFHGKVKIGSQTLLLAGKLRPADSGGFNIQIR